MIEIEVSGKTIKELKTIKEAKYFKNFDETILYLIKNYEKKLDE